MRRKVFDELGFSVRMRAAMRDALLRRREGLTLVSSVPGQGRSTTVTSLIFDFNPEPSSARRRAEARSGGVAMRISRLSIVDEICDERGAEIVHRRLERGDTVFATIQAGCIAESIEALLGFGFPSGDLSRWVRGCLNQRLVPAACPACRVPVFGATSQAEPFRDLIALLADEGEPGDISFAYCRGCDECAGLGQGGDTAVFEWLDPVCLGGLSAAASRGEMRAYLDHGTSNRGAGFNNEFGCGACITFEEDLRDKVQAHVLTIQQGASLQRSL